MLKKKKSFNAVCLGLLIAFLLIGCSSAFLPAASLSAAVTPDHITLTWVGDPRTTQTVTWRTDASNFAGQVQYIEATAGKLVSQSSRVVEAQVETVSTNLGNMNIHSATLTGLKPGTRYFYRVGNGSTWSEQHSFTTSANAATFKFLVFGDSQSSNYNVWRNTLHQAFQANPDAVFFTNVGDLVDVGQDYGEWNAWFEAARGVVETIPAMPVVGNHETYSPERRFRMPAFFTAQFKLPANGPEALSGQVYSFDYGDVHFSILDSQEGEEKQFVPDMLVRQAAWLEQDLKTTDKNWKVVFIHRPLFNNKLGDGDVHIRRAFEAIIDTYHVDIVFTGHDHAYARTYPLHGGAAVESPVKGTIYVAAGRSGTKTYRSALSKEWNEFFYNPQDEPNYITVEVGGKTLTVKAVKQSSDLIDTWSITK